MQPRQVSPSGFIVQAAATRLAMVPESPERAGPAAATPSLVARQGRRTPSLETRKLEFCGEEFVHGSD